jgi:hypothetical protein
MEHDPTLSRRSVLAADDKYAPTSKTHVVCNGQESCERFTPTLAWSIAVSGMTPAQKVGGLSFCADDNALPSGGGRG